MTANQIAAASEREGERHNQAYEAETERHNKRVEELEAEKNYIQNQYNTQSLALQAELNRNQLEYQYAAEEDKVMLENERNRITYDLGVAQRNYQYQMAEIERSKSEWNKTYHEAATAQGWSQVELEKKRTYYEQQKTEATVQNILASIELAKKKYQQDQTRIENDFKLGTITAETRQKELEQRKQEYQFEVDKWNGELKKQEHQKTLLLGVQAATAVTNSAANVVDSILPF